MDDITLTGMAPAQLLAELEKHRYQKLLIKAIDRIARVGYFEWSFEFDRLISCTEEYASIYGKTREQMLQFEDSMEKVVATIHPEDREAYRHITDQLLSNKSIEHEYRIVLDSGEIRHVREISVIEEDEQDGSFRSFGIMQDITGLREKRDALEYREALAHQAESVTEIGHFIYNELSETYSYISPGFARIFGTTAEEYVAKIQTVEDDLADIHPDDLTWVKQHYGKYDEDGMELIVEYRIILESGEVRWVRERNAPFRERDGVVIESLGVIQDITDRKTTEAELLEARSHLEEKVEQRTAELADTVKLLEEARAMLESKVERRTRELAKTVSRLEEEISEKELIAAELKFLANHDALTGLPSLRLCMDRLERSIAEARRNQLMSVVMFVDLDGFKAVNDNHGHEAGDNVLKQVSDRIREGIRDTDTAARVGGDEFVIILSSVDNLESVERIATSLIASISADFEIRQGKVHVGASIGIASYPADGDSADELMRQADTAMYMVKHNGKNNYGFLDSSQFN